MQIVVMIFICLSDNCGWNKKSHSSLVQYTPNTWDTPTYQSKVSTSITKENDHNWYVI